MTRQEYIAKVKEITNKPEYQPKGSTTYCNFFLREVAHLFNYNGFDKLMANDIVDLMDKDTVNFKQLGKVKSYISIESTIISEPVKFIIAGQKADKHGHVCVILPYTIGSYSAKWRKFVPKVANVGKDVFFEMGLNWAFAKEPNLYIYTGI